MKSRFSTTPLILVALSTTPALAQAQAPAAEPPLPPAAAPAAAAPAAGSAPGLNGPLPPRPHRQLRRRAMPRKRSSPFSARTSTNRMRAFKSSKRSSRHSRQSNQRPPLVPPARPSQAKKKPTAEKSADEETAVKVSAFVQAQYEHHEDSEDWLAPGGAPLNQDCSLVRRARGRGPRKLEVFVRVRRARRQQRARTVVRAPACRSSSALSRRALVRRGAARGVHRGSLRRAVRLRAHGILEEAPVHGTQPRLARLLPGGARSGRQAFRQARLPQVFGGHHERRAAR